MRKTNLPESYGCCITVYCITYQHEVTMGMYSTYRRYESSEGYCILAVSLQCNPWKEPRSSNVRCHGENLHSWVMLSVQGHAKSSSLAACLFPVVVQGNESSQKFTPNDSNSICKAHGIRIWTEIASVTRRQGSTRWFPHDMALSHANLSPVSWLWRQWLSIS